MTLVLIGAAIGCVVLAGIGLFVGEESRIVAPQPIQASLPLWVAFCGSIGAIAGAAIGGIVAFFVRL